MYEHLEALSRLAQEIQKTGLQKEPEYYAWVVLWPPDREEEECHVNVKEGDDQKRVEFNDFDEATRFAFKEAKRLSVKVGYPTNDGEIRDLDERDNCS